VLRCDVSRVLSATCPSRPSTSVPVKVLEMGPTTASVVPATAPWVEMIASECSLVSTKVWLISLVHGSCWSSLIRRRLVVIVMTLRPVGTRIIRLLVVILRILSNIMSVARKRCGSLETYG
jgi:hypothetical protein